MNKLLKSNINKSLTLINQGIPRIDPQLIEIEGEIDNARPIIAYRVFENRPNSFPFFYKENEQIKSPQYQYFGFFALMNMFRGVFTAVNYYYAGNLLLEKGLLAPALSMYYTCVFHLLPSYLALEGRVIIDPVRGMPKVIITKNSSSVSYKPLDDKTDLLIAILSGENKWIFEKRRRNHTDRWCELSHVFIEKGTYPKYFEELLAYLKLYFGNDFSINQFLREIPKIRHHALYESSAYDESAYDDLVNRDNFSSFRLDTKVKKFKYFAEEFFFDILLQIQEIIGQLETSKNLKQILFLGVYTPPFEVPQLKKYEFENRKISNDLAFLKTWLFSEAIYNS